MNLRSKKRKLTWMISDKKIKGQEKNTMNSDTPKLRTPSGKARGTEPRGPANTVGSGNWSQGQLNVQRNIDTKVLKHCQLVDTITRLS